MTDTVGIVSLDNQPTTSKLRHMWHSRLVGHPEPSTTQIVGAFSYATSKPDVSQHFTVEGNLTVIVNGRIDNLDELVTRLGCRASTDGASVIAHAWRRWGQRFATEVVGEFLLIIFDSESETFYGYTDHLASHQLYYLATRNRFFFGSEVYSVSAGVDATINSRRVIDQLTRYDFIVPGETLFDNVFALAPSSYLIFNSTGTRISGYESISPPAELRLSRASEYDDAFDAVIDKAIARRTPEACVTSGGIDSTYLASRANLAKPVSIYSGYLQTEQHRPEIMAIERFEACHPHELTRVLPDDQDEVVDTFLNTGADPGCFATGIFLRLYTAMRLAGYRHLIDGVEGDQVVSLPGSYPNVYLQSGNLAGYLQSCWELAQHELRYLPSVLEQTVKAALRDATALQQIRRARLVHDIKTRFAENLLRGELLTPDAIDRYEAAQRMPSFAHQQTLHLYNLGSPNLPLANERYRQVSRYCGVELSHPLLDRDVIEFCLSLPLCQKVSEGFSKVILRRAASRQLPASLCWRRDRDHLAGDFTANWEARHRDLICEQIMECSHLDQFFSRRALQRLTEADDDWLNHYRVQVYCLAHWLDRHNSRS